MRPTWDETFMLQAIVAGTRTSCLIRGVGAALVRDKRVIASGYNGAPPGLESCLDTQVCFYQNLAFQDSEKGLGSFADLKEQRKEFCSAIHAEKNAVNQCTNQGISPEGAVLYITNYPCPACVRDVIIPTKIAEVVIWKDYLRNPLLTLDEHGVSKFWLGQAKIPIRKLDLPAIRIQEISGLAFAVGERSPYQFTPPVGPKLE